MDDDWLNVVRQQPFVGFTNEERDHILRLAALAERDARALAKATTGLESLRAGYRSMVETLAAMVTAATGDKRASGDPVQIVRDLREQYEQAQRRADTLARELHPSPQGDDKTSSGRADVMAS